eukprot:TRINITY_DN7145_c0_g1_i1.p2 TRINITY_DN7145_c0_g1~~TRINITY_DN7145_c0_g1_i1.p2  ORF type:complete len:310 (-),score=83.40 TRINITY_DN7145_c0_g1_i1:1778-2707(-)
MSSSSSSSSSSSEENQDVGLVSVPLDAEQPPAPVEETSQPVEETTSQPVEETSQPVVEPQEATAEDLLQLASQLAPDTKEKKSSSSSSSSEGDGVEILSGDHKADYTFKIILIGDSAVGKSSLFKSWGFTTFDTSLTPTLSPETLSKTVKISGEVVKVNLWDTAGQEQFRAITRGYYRNSTCAIIVYDITRLESFESVERWLADIKEGAGNDELNIMLIGNKSDLKHSRQVQKGKALEFAKENNLHFLETSAKEGKNVTRAFNILLTDTYKEKRQFLNTKDEKGTEVASSSETVVIGGTESDSKGDCEC